MKADQIFPLPQYLLQQIQINDVSIPSWGNYTKVDNCKTVESDVLMELLFIAILIGDFQFETLCLNDIELKTFT